MNRIYFIIKKEILEITRDLQTFALLILMPLVFILIMSLSMQELFKPSSNVKINVIVVDRDISKESKKFLEDMKKIEAFSTTESKGDISIEKITGAIKKGHYKFGLIINRSFSSYIRDFKIGPGATPLTLYVDPTVQIPYQAGLKNQLELHLSRLRLNALFYNNPGLQSCAGLIKEIINPSSEGVLKPLYVYSDKKESVIPNAAQQSVPAWLVFSMYFIVMPISLIFHTEKNNGTLIRLRSINIKSRYLIAGKIVSYYFICMIQVVCMLCVGRYLVPLLGGDTIRLGNSFFGLFVIASCVAINAIAFGLMVYAASKNTQVAGSLGSILIVIFSAIGGIMVPKFVMPKYMQQLSNISPLSCGMDGFLNIMLKNGSVADIITESVLLLGTGFVMLAITGLVLKKKLL
jgi:ABC-2 type transport system permease protein